jgi:dihydrolipoamide dehydrogenase
LETKLKSFDLIVVGSGPGGYTSAILASRKGLSVAVVEKSELGGTCLNRGCIPTKAILEEALLWESFSGSGWVKDKAELGSHYKKALEKKDAAVNQVVSGLRSLLNQNHITIVEGEASFINRHSLIIKKGGAVTERIESDRILIATGAVPEEIPGLKWDGQWVIDSDDALEMTSPPSDIIIIGGGRRGVELATFFNAFGAKVTLIEKENRILSKMDREISVRYRGLLMKRNIKVFTEAEVLGSRLTEKNTSLVLSVRIKGREEKLEAQKILVVGNRRGNLDGLDVGTASISLRDGFISVDGEMKTSSSGIYAAGDVVGKGFMAHKAFVEARTAIENLLGKGVQMKYQLIPICLYAFPEAASIGITEEEAKEKYGTVKVGKFPFIGCGRAVVVGKQEGIVKILSDPKYGEILGVHILGPGATEMIHLAAMAMKQEMVIDEIKQIIFAHPTFSEAFFEAALDTYGEAIHIMKG